MGSITVTMNVTLDGVVQGPGRADEDTRGNFALGGWGQGYDDDVAMREMGADMSRPGDMLLGRRTWEDFAKVWGGATDGNPFSTHMNATTKYVVSRTRQDVDEWQNSVLLRGDAVESVAELKAESDRDLGIVGSVSLVRDLHAAGLIDYYTLLIAPLTLGSGSRLFDEPGTLTKFELIRCVNTSTGVIIARYARR
jgi:dihydrofolate reductase